MISLGIGILTRDNPDILAVSLAHHIPLLQSINMPVYVFDNSTHTDNSELIKKYPYIKYHKHTKDLCYDESFRFAVENVKEDYVWIISDRLKIGIGAVPFIYDYIQRGTFSAILIGNGFRLSMLGEPFVEPDPKRLMRTVAWHAILCGGIIFHKDTIRMVEKDKYMGYEFMHLCILFDGIIRSKNSVLIITHSFINSFGDFVPSWLHRHVEIWSNKLTGAIMALPDFYQEKEKILLAKNTGFNGKFLVEGQFMSLASMGYFNMEILKKYEKDIKRVCMVPMKRLKEIAKLFKE